MPSSRAHWSALLFLLLAAAWIFAGWQPEPGYYKSWPGVQPIWSDPIHGLPRIWAGESTLGAYLLDLGYFSGCCILGWRVFLRPVLLGSVGGLRMVPVMAGFIPGYLLLAPFNRILTLLIPNRPAAFLELGCVAGFAAWTIYLALQGRYTNPKPERKNRSLGIQVLGQIWPLLALLIVLVWGICHVTGDATGFTFQAIFNNAKQFPAPNSHLPFFGQHYDEIAFLHPVLFSGLLTADSDLLAPYWLMTGFARMSVLFICYFCVRRLGLQKLEAVGVALFLFLSSIEINPLGDWEFVDSSHSLVYTAHPARLVGGIAPLVFAVGYIKFLRGARLRSLSRSLWIAVALGLGITSLSFHVFATLLLMGGLCLALLPPTCQLKRTVAWTAVPWSLMLLILPPIAYERRFDFHGQHLVFFAFCMGAAIYALYRRGGFGYLKAWIQAPNWSGKLLRTAAWLGGALFGFVFLGNLFAPKLGLYKLLGLELLTRGVSPGAFAPGLINTSLPAIANVLWSASSPSHFIAAFGLPLLLCASVFFTYGTMRPSSRRANLLLCLVECMLLGYLGALVLFHFMGKGVTFWLELWVRSRFTEGWLYGLSAASLCALFKISQRRYRHLILGLVLFWALLPWIGNFKGVLAGQIVSNLRWMLNQLHG